MKQLWKYLKGKKRNIGIMLLTIMEGVNLFTDVMPDNVENWATKVITLLLLGAAADSDKGRDALNTVKNTSNKTIKSISDGAKKLVQK